MSKHNQSIAELLKSSLISSRWTHSVSHQFSVAVNLYIYKYETPLLAEVAIVLRLARLHKFFLANCNMSGCLIHRKYEKIVTPKESPQYSQCSRYLRRSQWQRLQS